MVTVVWQRRGIGGRLAGYQLLSVRYMDDGSRKKSVPYTRPAFNSVESE